MIFLYIYPICTVTGVVQSINAMSIDLVYLITICIVCSAGQALNTLMIIICPLPGDLVERQPVTGTVLDSDLCLLRRSLVHAFTFSSSSGFCAHDVQSERP